MEKQRIPETLTVLKKQDSRGLNSYGKNGILDILLIFGGTKDFPVLKSSRRNRILETLPVFVETKDSRDLTNNRDTSWFPQELKAFVI